MLSRMSLPGFLILSIGNLALVGSQIPTIPEISSLAPAIPQAPAGIPSIGTTSSPPSSGPPRVTTVLPRVSSVSRPRIGVPHLNTTRPEKYEPLTQQIPPPAIVCMEPGCNPQVRPWPRRVAGQTWSEPVPGNTSYDPQDKTADSPDFPTAVFAPPVEGHENSLRDDWVQWQLEDHPTAEEFLRNLRANSVPIPPTASAASLAAGMLSLASGKTSSGRQASGVQLGSSELIAGNASAVNQSDAASSLVNELSDAASPLVNESSDAASPLVNESSDAASPLVNESDVVEARVTPPTRRSSASNVSSHASSAFLKDSASANLSASVKLMGGVAGAGIEVIDHLPTSEQQQAGDILPAPGQPHIPQVVADTQSICPAAVHQCPAGTCASTASACHEGCTNADRSTRCFDGTCVAAASTCKPTPATVSFAAVSGAVDTDVFSPQVIHSSDDKGRHVVSVAPSRGAHPPGTLHIASVPAKIAFDHAPLRLSGSPFFCSPVINVTLAPLSPYYGLKAPVSLQLPVTVPPSMTLSDLCLAHWLPFEKAWNCSLTALGPRGADRPVGRMEEFGLQAVIVREGDKVDLEGKVLRMLEVKDTENAEAEEPMQPPVTESEQGAAEIKMAEQKQNETRYPTSAATAIHTGTLGWCVAVLCTVMSFHLTAPAGAMTL